MMNIVWLMLALPVLLLVMALMCVVRLQLWLILSLRNLAVWLLNHQIQTHYPYAENVIMIHTKGLNGIGLSGTCCCPNEEGFIDNG